MKKTNTEWDKIFSGLKSLENVKGIKLVYAISKNKDKIESHLRHLEGLLKPNEEYVEFDNKRVAIVEKHAKKDEYGNPVIKNDSYDVDVDLVKPEVGELEKEYKKVIDDRKKQIEEFNALLAEEVEIDIHTVQLKETPEDISLIQFEKIKFMIEE